MTLSIHRITREQWDMMMEGLLRMEPLPSSGPTPKQAMEDARRRALWLSALESLRSICPGPRP